MLDIDHDTDDNDLLLNPGSDAARELGCTCAVFDNNRGLWKPWAGEWWITFQCPVHDPPSLVTR